MIKVMIKQQEKVKIKENEEKRETRIKSNDMKVTVKSNCKK